MELQTACCDSCGSAAERSLAVSCALDAPALGTRIESIRDLAARALRQSERRGLMLDLVYDPAARAEVEELVAGESACCGFLDFALHEDDAGLRLTITAPPDAATAAEELFAHFTGAPAREVA